MQDFYKASVSYSVGDMLLELGREKTTESDPRRIQISAAEFILPPYLIYHSCVPNAYIDWEDMSLKALSHIDTGDIITYHYGTSEYDYSGGAFVCDCGHVSCIGYFRGFQYMTREQRYDIRAYLSPYLVRFLTKE